MTQRTRGAPRRTAMRQPDWPTAGAWALIPLAGLGALLKSVASRVPEQTANMLRFGIKRLRS
ncbi:MAG: hypothetical protein ACRD2I_02020, partial [Vicinamibacterales bacterium]